MNHLLYGTDETERIVGLAMHGDKHVNIWTRDKDGTVTSFMDRVYPFIYTTDEGIERIKQAVGANRFTTAAAYGRNRLNALAVFDTIETFRAARKVFYNDETLSGDFFAYGDPTSAYLVHSGKTMFKGMSPAETHRMQVDIESWRIDGFPDAARDPIFIISISDNRGYRKCLYQTTNPEVDIPDFNAVPDFAEEFPTEEALLRELVKVIQRRDPDVIEGHNIFGFDLPYILQRCNQTGVNFAIGRDSKPPYTYDATMKFAERDIRYTNFLVGGRTVIDTMFLAIDWDVYTRELDGVGLKDVARTLGVAPKDRVYIEGDEIAQSWLDDPVKVLHYALHDVEETLGISEKLCSAQFALTQMIPLPYQKVHLGGKAGVIQSLFVREYLRKREALPVPPPSAGFPGGFTEIYKTGVYDNIWYIDVASLYPSIMLNFNIKPEHDTLGLFRDILNNLTELRFQTKGAMKAATGRGDTKRAGELDARQQAFKIIINSFYGMLGAGGIALFATPSEAERVTRIGQSLLKRMMELIAAEGGDIIECDTDGVLAVAPPDRDFFQDGPAFCAEITEKMPDGITVDFDGAYLRMMSLKKKNYALMDLDENIKVKGGSLKSRSLEPLFRDYVEQQIENILYRNTEGIRDIHRGFQELLMSNIDPELLARTVTLKDSLEVYQAKVERGSNRAPQYEIALDLVRAKGLRVQKGDRVSYVITGTKKPYKVRSFVDGTYVDDVVPGTHNTLWYLRRLQKVAEGRFGTFFADKDLGKVFPPDPPSNTINMFGEPTFDGCDIQNKTVNSYES